GSMGSRPLNAPVVGMIGYGDGYLMVASDGGIFNFSERAFVGSFGGAALPAPIVGVAGLPDLITGSPWRIPVLPPGDGPIGDVVIDPGAGTLAPVAFSRRSTEGGTFPAPPEHRDQTLAVTGDLDGDGIDDIVIGGRRGSEDSLVWFRRTGDTWERRTIETDSLRIEAGGALGDIDGDGDLDLVAGEDTTGDELWWWENPAPATPDRWVRRVVKRGAGNQHHDQVLADLDGDGELELAFWNQRDGDALRIAEIPADPTVEPWPSSVVFRGATRSEGLATGDVDGDGVAELVGGGYWFDHSNGIYTAVEIDRSMSETRVVTGQFVEGGRPEVVFDSADAVGPLRLYEWDGTTWVGRDLLAEPNVRGHNLDSGDVNGDGHLDLLTGEVGIDADDHPQLRILYGDGAGGFAHQIVSAGVGMHESELADLDGDGDLDVLGKPFRPGDPSVTVWINQGNRPGPLGGWHRHVVDDAVGHRTVFVEHADLDGDGDEDLVTGGWWWRNPGVPGGSWERVEIGGDLRQVALVHDLDGDGDVDLFGGDEPGSGWDGDLRWARNDGDGGFEVFDDIESAEGGLLQGVVAVDLVPGVTSIALSYNDGVGGLQLVTVPSDPTRSRWTTEQAVATVAGEELVAADVDGDGDADLFDGEAWYRNDGGRLSRIVVVTVGAGEPDRVALADVDGDGDLDGVVGFGEDGVGRVRWYEQGDDPAAPWAERVIDDLGDANALSLDVGDVDGDGDPDVVVGEHTNPSTDGLRTLVYENRGGTFVARVIEAGDEHHDGTQLVDLDGDGDLDLVTIGWLHRRLIVLEHVG
ncbi:MAG: VCBS repeat-containing protein, partial [Actinomycetota bacterium]